VVASIQDDWSRHWRQYADSAQNNPAQAYRRKLILAHLAGTLPVAKVLDIGSGQGDLAAQLRARYPEAEIRGLELSEVGVEIASRKVPSARFFQRDLLLPMEPPAEQASWATHAVCSEVLEHVERPDVLLRHALAYLAPGCRLIVTVPGGPVSSFDRHIGHRKHYTRRDLRRLLSSAGLEVERVSAAGFPFFNLYRIAILLRGEKLISDVASEGTGAPSGLARLMMKLFRMLFVLNLESSPWGWQLLATARTPARRDRGSSGTRDDRPS
jgi:trans-aconitate methyltransferase